MFSAHENLDEYWDARNIIAGLCSYWSATGKMTTILKKKELINVNGLDWWRNRSKVFRQHPWVHWVVTRKAYVEEKGKSSGMSDNANIANTNACPSVIHRKNSVWLWNPQRKPSAFRREVSFVYIITFLKRDFLTLLQLILMTCSINNVVCFTSARRLTLAWLSPIRDWRLIEYRSQVY